MSLLRMQLPVNITPTKQIVRCAPTAECGFLSWRPHCIFEIGS